MTNWNLRRKGYRIFKSKWSHCKLETRLENLQNIKSKDFRKSQKQKVWHHQEENITTVKRETPEDGMTSESFYFWQIQSLFLFLCLCVLSVCVAVPSTVTTGVTSSPMQFTQVLWMELGSSTKAVYILNHRVISTASRRDLKKWLPCS